MAGGFISRRPIYLSQPSVIATATTDTSIFSATGYGSQTVGPESFYLGARFEFKARGLVTTGALNVSSVVCKLKMGSLTLASISTAALQVSSNTIAFFAEGDIKVTAIGVSGTVNAGGYVEVVQGNSPLKYMLAGTGALDLTQSQLLDATIALTSLVGSPTITITDAKIDQCS